MALLGLYEWKDLWFNGTIIIDVNGVMVKLYHGMGLLWFNGNIL